MRVISLSCAVLEGQIRPAQTKIRQSEGEPAMAKYVTFFTCTSEAWARMIQNPGDRAATVRQLADSLGGRLSASTGCSALTTGWSLQCSRLDWRRRPERHCRKHGCL